MEHSEYRLSYCRTKVGLQVALKDATRFPSLEIMLYLVQSRVMWLQTNDLLSVLEFDEGVALADAAVVMIKL